MSQNKSLCQKLVSGILAVVMLFSNFSWGKPWGHQYLRAPNSKVVDQGLDFKVDEATKQKIAADQEVSKKDLKTILGDYKIANKRILSDNHTKEIIDISDKTVKQKLETFFDGEKTKKEDEYSILYYCDLAIAIVKKGKDGSLKYKTIVDDVANISLSDLVEDLEAAKKAGVTKVLDVALRDYVFLERQSAKDVSERNTVNYQDMAAYHKKFLEESDRCREEIENVQKQIKGEITDSEVVNRINIITNAYMEHAEEFKEDDAKYYAYREITVKLPQGEQKFKVKLTKKEEPKVTTTPTGERMEEIYEWYVENITVDNLKGLNPSIVFYGRAPEVLEKFGRYRDFSKPSAFAVLNPGAKTKEDNKTKKLKEKLARMEDDYDTFLKEKSGITIAGGKGLNLSLINEVFPVPYGFNITSTAYFRFVKENPGLFELILKKLGDLDTTNETNRGYTAREIREAIEKAKISDEMKEEILIMYRQINVRRALAKKKTPAAVAVRSSGIKEDLIVESWLQIKTGSQAGQSATFLNVKGEKALIEKVILDWASLFTNQAVSYRDDSIFIIFSSLMGFKERNPKEVYDWLMNRLYDYSKDDHPEFRSIANVLSGWNNPGSVKLMNAMKIILDKMAEEKKTDTKEYKDLEKCLKLMRKTADDFVRPDKIGIDVVVQQMVKAYLAGVLFTVNPATKMAGVPQSLYQAWYGTPEERRNAVWMDEKGNIIGTKPNVMSFEINPGYGEPVVGGGVVPDFYTLFKNTHGEWCVAGKTKGSKLVQMINVEECVENMSKKMDIEDLKAKDGGNGKLVKMLEKALAYSVQTKEMKGFLATHLHAKYIKHKTNPEQDMIDNEKFAEWLQEMILTNKPKDKMIREMKKNYIFTEDEEKGLGLTEKHINEWLDEIINRVAQSREDTVKGEELLTEYFQGDSDVAKTFIEMCKGENEVAADKEKHVLDKLKLNKNEFTDLVYVMESLMKKSFTAMRLTVVSHRDSFCITDEAAVEIAKMGEEVSRIYFKDGKQRDIEFAIEIDPSVRNKKGAIQLYVKDNDGNVLVMNEKGELKKTDKKPEDLKGEGMASLKLYCVQARPWTSDFIQVDYVRKGTEVDVKFIESHNIKPIATGTTGENAVAGVTIVYDKSKSNDWHAELIKRWQRGEFTPQEKEQLVNLGLNPDDYGPGKETLPINMYFVYADPSHDPLMRLVNAVVTREGGKTSHASIFMREQGKPGVCGTGEIKIDGKPVKTGDGLIVNAEHGYIYKFDPNPKKRIPILSVEQIIEFYAIATDPDFPEKMTKIGWVTSDEDAVQKLTPDFFAPDNGGKELVRAEEKVNKIGVNPIHGYTYDLLERIKRGETAMPERVYIENVLEGKVKAKGLDKFVAGVNEEIYEYLTKTSNKKVLNEVLKLLNKKEYKKEYGFQLLAAFDVLRDLESKAIENESLLNSEQEKMVKFIGRIRRINQDSADLLYYCYDCFQTRLNYDYNLIEDFNNHPWIKGEIEAKLKEKGYPSFKEMAGQEFYYFYNMMGFTTRPDEKDRGRAWDAAADKADGLIGTTDATCRKSRNCLYGFRGTALEILGLDPDMDLVGNQKVTAFLIKQKIRANKNTGNQSFFYVFLRTPREAKMLKQVLRMIKEETGELPEEIGFMGETASFVLYAEEFMKVLAEIRDELGVKSVFVSFGTNDLTSSYFNVSRDNSGTNLVILHPSAINAIPEMKAAGYYFDKNGKLPLADDGSPIIGRAIEAVAAQARKYGVKLMLCGERITNLADRGDDNSAGDTMLQLDGVGISMQRVRLFVSYIGLDSMSKHKEIIEPENKRKLLFDLSGSEITQKGGIMKGEVVYLNEATDLIPEVLKGYEGPDLEKERIKIALQSPDSLHSVVRTYNRIVVITKNLVEMTKEELLLKMNEADFNKMIEAKLIKAKGENRYIWMNLNLTADKFSDQLKNMGYDNENVRNGILAAWEKAWNNTRKGMEKRNIRWHELRYPRAIVVDKGVDLEGWDVFEDQDVARRIKVKVKTKSLKDSIPERQFVTIDYGSGKIYQGNLQVKWNEIISHPFSMPAYEPKVDEKPAVREDANQVRFKFHPLVLMAYKEGKLDLCDRLFSEESCDLLDELMEIAEEIDLNEKKSLLASFEKEIDRISDRDEQKYLFKMREKVARGGKVDDFDKKFNKYVSEQVDKLMKVSQEPDKDKKKYELGKFEKEISNLADKTIKEFFQGIIAKINNNEKISLPENWNEELQVKYFSELKKDIAKTLAGKSVDQFIKDAFKERMRKVLKANPGKFVVHKTISRNCVEFGATEAAFLVEDITPDPDLGLLAAARGIADMSPLTDLELLSFKEVRAELLPEERKNFGLEISKVVSGAIVIAWKHILRDLGIIPVKDGLEIGVEVCSAADTDVLDEYFKHFKEKGFSNGFTFANCESRKLAGFGWLTSDIYWNLWRHLIKDKELEQTEKIALKLIKAKLEKMNNADKSVNRRLVVFEDQMEPEILAKTIDDYRAGVLAKSSQFLDKFFLALSNRLMQDLTDGKGKKISDGEAIRAQQEEAFNLIQGLIASGDITFEDLDNFLDSDKLVVETPVILALVSAGAISLEQAEAHISLPEAIRSRIIPQSVEVVKKNEDMPVTTDEIYDLHGKAMISFSEKGKIKDQIIELTRKLAMRIAGVPVGISNSEKYFINQNRMFDVVFDLIKNGVIGSKIVVGKGIFEDKIIEAQLILSLVTLQIIRSEKAAEILGIEKSVVERIVSIYNQGGWTAKNNILTPWLTALGKEFGVKNLDFKDPKFFEELWEKMYTSQYANDEIFKELSKGDWFTGIKGAATIVRQVIDVINEMHKEGIIDGKKYYEKENLLRKALIYFVILYRIQSTPSEIPLIYIKRVAKVLGINENEIKMILSIRGNTQPFKGITDDYYLNFVNKADKALDEKGIKLDQETKVAIANSLKSENTDGIEILLKEKEFSEGQIWQVQSAIALEMDKEMVENTNPSGKSESQVRKVVANGGKGIDNIDKVNSGVFITDQSMHNIGGWQSIKELADSLKGDLGKIKVFVEGDAKAIQNLGFTNVEVVEIGKVTKEEIEKRVGQRFVIIAADGEEIAGVDKAKILRLGKIEGQEMILMPFALIKALKQLVGGGEELNQVLEDIALEMLTSLKNAGYINGELNTEEKLRALASKLVIGNTVPAIPISENVSRDRYLFWKLAEKA